MCRCVGKTCYCFSCFFVDNLNNNFGNCCVNFNCFNFATISVGTVNNFNIRCCRLRCSKCLCNGKVCNFNVAVVFDYYVISIAYCIAVVLIFRFKCVCYFGIFFELNGYGCVLRGSGFKVFNLGAFFKNDSAAFYRQFNVYFANNVERMVIDSRNFNRACVGNKINCCHRRGYFEFAKFNSLDCENSVVIFREIDNNATFGD